MAGGIYLSKVQLFKSPGLSGRFHDDEKNIALLGILHMGRKVVYTFDKPEY
jgi:hypothetical protein